MHSRACKASKSSVSRTHTVARTLTWSVLSLGLLSGTSTSVFSQTRPMVDPRAQEEEMARAAAAAFAASRAWRFEPSIGLTVTSTNNSGLSFADDTEADVIVEIEPRFKLRGRGASFTLDGDLGGSGFVYTNSTQKNRLLPSGNISLKTVPIDQWLYFDLSALVEQEAADPYATRADSKGVLNKINSVQYRVTPYIQHNFTPLVSLLLKSDNIWTRRRGEFSVNDARRDSAVNRESFVFERLPRPFGLSVEASRETTKYLSGLETVLRIGSARGVASYAIDPTFVVGLIGGQEISEYALSRTTDVIAGVRANWAPSERTEIKGTFEDRFFGKGGSIEWRHRSPFIGFSLSAAREPSALGTSFSLNPGIGDVGTLLDAIYTTRYPNPAERAVIVANATAGLGLPIGLSTPIEVFADYAQLRETVLASAVFQGVRTTLAVRAYHVKSVQLTRDDAPFVPLVGELDNVQSGLSVDLNRRMTATLSMELGVGTGSIKGLGVADGQKTTNHSVRLGFTRSLSPKTRVTLGARYLKTEIATGLGPDASADEAAAFAGIVHRY